MYVATTIKSCLAWFDIFPPISIAAIQWLVKKKYAPALLRCSETFTNKFFTTVTGDPSQIHYAVTRSALEWAQKKEDLTCWKKVPGAVALGESVNSREARIM